MQDVLHDDVTFEKNVELVAKESVEGGCTKTLPIIPDLETMKKLVREIYYGPYNKKAGEIM